MPPLKKWDRKTGPFCYTILRRGPDLGTEKWPPFLGCFRPVGDFSLPGKDRNRPAHPDSSRVVQGFPPAKTLARVTSRLSNSCSADCRALNFHLARKRRAQR